MPAQPEAAVLGHVRPLLATLVGTDSERRILNLFYSRGIGGLGVCWVSFGYYEVT